MLRISLYVCAAVLLDGVAGLAGGLVPERFLERFRALLVSFAVGALLGAVFFDLLPEALVRGDQTVLRWTLAGFAALALYSWVTEPDARHGPSIVAPSLARLLLSSDALHNMGDGAAVAAAFVVSPKAGAAMAFAVIAHEVPQEVGDYALLRAAGMSKGRALVALAAVQLTALIGAAAVLFAAQWAQTLARIVPGLAAGSFLYIAAAGLMPELSRPGASSSRPQRVVGFVLGIAVMVAMALL